MPYAKKRKELRLLYCALAIALLWTAGSMYLFVDAYTALYQRGFLPGFRDWSLTLQRHPPTNTDIDRLKPWMTFAFVNTVFLLPPEYLRNALVITDVRYPNVTILEVAKTEESTSGALLHTTQELVRARLLVAPEASK